MMRHILFVAFTLFATGAAHASWDGIWAGMLNKTEPVSVTISGSKVTAYTIRGMMPLAIQSSIVGLRAASFVVGADYSVRLIKRGERVALAVAHGPLGNWTASLIRQ
jgi:hypothetical protein